MTEEEDTGIVNTDNNNNQMEPQDKVLLVTGTWVQEVSRKWVFDQTVNDPTTYITLTSGLSFAELVKLVRERLSIVAPNITVKLSYQYPEWMAIDDGDGSTLQYISDDHEVEVFVQMRRKIEEVNLCVSISQTVNGVKTPLLLPPTDNIPMPESDDISTESDSSLEEPDSEWHDFAISETPLTYPIVLRPRDAPSQSRRSCSIPSAQGGIVIADGKPSLGSMAGSYALIPAYLGLLETANPGSICRLETTPDLTGDTMFKYCFIAFGASINGYPFMRKALVIDGTNLKGRYGGCLISASMQDGNFQIFPLAFAVVNGENDEAWEWFFSKLQTFVADSTDLVFISDRHGSIYTGLRKVYPLAQHATCTVHLWCNIRSRFKSKKIASLMTVASRAFTVADFNEKFLKIQRAHPGCAAYLVEIGFEHWSRAHFKGCRYNIMDSNIAESWNSVLKEAREYPLISMLEYIRTTIMSWLALRRSKAEREKGPFTPKVQEILEENIDGSTGFGVAVISDFEFQVQGPDGQCFNVNLKDRTCTCRAFQLLRFPCPHAFAAACRGGIPTVIMVGTGYYVDTWRRGFEERIYPVPSGGNLELGGGMQGELLPPAVKRPPGRPRKLRILSRREFQRGVKRSSRRCTRCRLEGHNKASCRNAL